MGTWIALVLLIVAGVALVAGEGASFAGLPVGDFAMAIASLGLIVFLVSAMLSAGRGGFLRALRDFAVWSMIAIALVAGYSYRAEITTLAYRVVGELVPPGETIAVDNRTGERSVRLRRRADGHFIARTEVNGAKLSMLVDTGATSVVLKLTDAELIGIDVKRLAFTVPVQTANGATFAAPVRLKSIAIGAIVYTEIDALVAKKGALKESLLGMSFLNRLRSYEFAGEFLTLRS